MTFQNLFRSLDQFLYFLFKENTFWSILAVLLFWYLIFVVYHIVCDIKTGKLTENGQLVASKLIDTLLLGILIPSIVTAVWIVATTLFWLFNASEDPYGNPDVWSYGMPWSEIAARIMVIVQGLVILILLMVAAYYLFRGIVKLVGLGINYILIPILKKIASTGRAIRPYIPIKW